MADQLTPEESLARFAALQKGPNRIQEASEQGLQLVYTERDEDKSLFYVFSHPADEGFVILAADDVIPVVLGYSDAGPFDIDNMPPNLRYWLEDCSQAISATIGADRPLAQPAKRARATIAPIVTTTWGQGQASNGTKIYNKYSPVIEGKTAPTGCVATAMAQIMNFHEWPTRGTGSHSYTTSTYKKDLSADFSSTTYDWANMKDHYAKTWNVDEYSTYDAGFTTTTNEAVSKLMYHCGIAADMDYGPEQSRAYDYHALRALANNFNYNPGAYMAEREFYTDDEWEDLVYNQLLGNRPVYYTGVTEKSEGHAFVCDGYKNGMFHINWGWDGMSNGYYTFIGRDALHPTAQGTGGSYTSNAFCLLHTIFADLTKPAEAPAKQHFFGIKNEYEVYDYDSEESHLHNGDHVIAKFEQGCFNFEANKVSVISGIHLINIENGKDYYIDGGTEYKTLELQQGFSHTMAVCQDVPDGVYKAIPTFRYKGESRWVDAHVMTHVAIPVVSVGNAEIPSLKADAALCCSTVQFTDGGNNQRKLNVHVTNPGNVGDETFSGYVAPAIVNESGNIVTVLEGAKQAFEMESMKYNPDKTFDFSAAIPATVADGHYYVALGAFQTGSTNWTLACFLDVSNPSSVGFDQSTVTSSEFWLNGNVVSIQEPVAKADAELCCTTVEITDGGNDQRNLNVRVTSPGNVGDEKFEGYVAPGILDEHGNIVVVLESVKKQFTIESMKCKTNTALDYSAALPSNIPDGHYYVAFCAFQVGSTNWTTARYLSPELKYDASKTPSCAFWLKGKSVRTKEPDGMHDILATEAPQTDIYDLQGRRITTPATRGISIVGGRKVIR